MSSSEQSPPRPAEPSLYETDFFAWLEEQDTLLRNRRSDGLDWTHIADEIANIGRSQKTGLRSRLIRLLVHLLKWQFQPDLRCQSWLSSIMEERTIIAGMIEDSPSLRRFPGEALARCYATARPDASLELQMPAGHFPETCPYAIHDIMDREFLPGPDWRVEKLRPA